VPRVKYIKAREQVLCGGPSLAPIYQNWHNICLIEAYLGYQPDASLPDPPLKRIHAGPSYANPTQDLPSAATGGVNQASHHLPPGLLS